MENKFNLTIFRIVGKIIEFKSLEKNNCINVSLDIHCNIIDMVKDNVKDGNKLLDLANDFENGFKELERYTAGHVSPSEIRTLICDILDGDYE